ncbi:lactonase family protein [Microbacterium dauci]|uniref:Beta-propeller fold lactonase family protein n=1 Tax=Microbacterium dauci TaxID=3048008 RepID=A0ABT6ZF40_9MICO|nr:beta-propeller fold lactonase family protein [Microbacterium sp. LX3-4]MDJ1114788.1 beta-propeller fold lactonase family protein [Microbacterium sp. LX3-4]
MPSSLALVANSGDSSISTFRIADGTLERLAVTARITGCSNFAVDAARGFVYASVKADATHAEPGILTLTLDRETGELTEHSRVDLPDGAMNYLALTRDGSALLGAAYSGGYGIVASVDDGVVSAPIAEVRFPRLHSVLASDDGRFAYFVSLEADLVAQYALGDDLALTPLEPAVVPAPTGSGPRHIALDDSRGAAYVLTEFSAEVLHFDRDAESGLLTYRDFAPAHDPAAGLGHSVIDEKPLEHHYVWGADLHLGDGVVWASERTASTLAAVPLAADGSVSAPDAYTVTEPQPRGFALSGDGRVLLAAGERSTTVSLYAVDGAELTLSHQAETGRGANWVRFV